MAAIAPTSGALEKINKFANRRAHFGTDIGSCADMSTVTFLCVDTYPNNLEILPSSFFDIDEYSKSSITTSIFLSPGNSSGGGHFVNDTSLIPVYSFEKLGSGLIKTICSNGGFALHIMFLIQVDLPLFGGPARIARYGCGKFPRSLPGCHVS